MPLNKNELWPLIIVKTKHKLFMVVVLSIIEDDVFMLKYSQSKIESLYESYLLFEEKSLTLI